MSELPWEVGSFQRENVLGKRQQGPAASQRDIGATFSFRKSLTANFNVLFLPEGQEIGARARGVCFSVSQTTHSPDKQNGDSPSASFLPARSPVPSFLALSALLSRRRSPQFVEFRQRGKSLRQSVSQ